MEFLVSYIFINCEKTHVFFLPQKFLYLLPFLNGITRRCVIDIAKTKGIKIVERKIKPEEMENFVGCFLTGTAAEVTPVSQIDKYKFTICNVIKDLSESYQALVRKKTAA